jgi:hypothetical protein
MAVRMRLKRITADPNLGQLERGGPSVTDDPRPYIEQPGLQASQQPVGCLLRQVGLLLENTAGSIELACRALSVSETCYC